MAEEEAHTAREAGEVPGVLAAAAAWAEIRVTSIRSTSSLPPLEARTGGGRAR